MLRGCRWNRGCCWPLSAPWLSGSVCLCVCTLRTCCTMHAYTQYISALLRWWDCCCYSFSGSCVAGMPVQLVEGVGVRPLLRHTLWICLPGCRWCVFWSTSRSHSAQVVDWTGVWGRCVWPSLRILYVLPCSFRSRNRCVPWCWPCWWSNSIRRFLMCSASVVPVLMA